MWDEKRGNDFMSEDGGRNSTNLDSALSVAAICSGTASNGAEPVPSETANTASVIIQNGCLDERYGSLLRKFLEAMDEIGQYGFQKYGEQSFQAQCARNDCERIPRQAWKKLEHHAHTHAMEYERGIKHDHFGTRRHQLAAAAFNLMMEFYFAGLENEA